MNDSRAARTPRQVLADAEAFGVELTLIDAQLRRTPEERMRVASDAAGFVREMRRGLPYVRAAAPIPVAP